MIESVPLRIYQQMIDTINDGIMLVGPDGKIKLANVAMEKISGYSRKELIQSTCAIINCDVCEKARSKSKTSWCGLFKYGKAPRKRCLIERKDGSYASLMKTAKLIKDDDDKIFGALDIFTDLSEISKRDLEIQNLSSLLREEQGFHGIVGRSAVMQQIYQIIEKVASNDSPVIITGETGTGKELVARAIHKTGRRREGPYVQFNCAALNESLCESELFGHSKGAYTDACRHRKGRFETAHGGDIFLDEIGEMSPTVQAKLLRVLETGQFERVGDNKSLRADVRVIAATNKNLSEMILNGNFRQDLFYRINAIPLHLPPLRERMEDIPLLVNAFISEFRTKSQVAISGIRPEVMDLFMRYLWPGNIRELKSTLEYAFMIAGTDRIDLQHLPALIKGFADDLDTPKIQNNSDDINERTKLVDALRQCHGNKTKAAQMLGIHRMTIWNRMKKHGVELSKIIKT